MNRQQVRVALAAVAVLGLAVGSASAQRYGTVTIRGPVQPAFGPQHYASYVVQQPTVSVPWSGPINLQSYRPGLTPGGYSTGAFLNYGPYSGMGFSSIQPYSPGYVGLPIVQTVPVPYYVSYEIPVFNLPIYLSPTRSTWGLDNRRPYVYSGYYYP